MCEVRITKARLETVSGPCNVASPGGGWGRITGQMMTLGSQAEAGMLRDSECSTAQFKTLETPKRDCDVSKSWPPVQRVWQRCEKRNRQSTETLPEEIPVQVHFWSE